MKLLTVRSYRKARSIDRFLVVDRRLVESLERELARQAGAACDNHTTYIFEDDSCYRDVIVASFHDSNAFFGRGIDDNPY